MNTAREIASRLQQLLRDEHGAMSEFLVALADFDRRRSWLELGHASLFDFLRRDLGLSKSAASFRKKAAELIQRCPAIVEPLRDGRLCLSSVFEVGKVLTPDNAHEVLPRFFQLGKREARQVAAALRPDDAPAMRDVVTTVVAGPRAGAAAAPPADVLSLSVVSPAKPVHANSAPPTQEGPPAPRPQPSSAEPLTAELSRVHFTASRAFLKKLDAARDALSHSHPNAGMEEILEAGLDLLLQRAARRNGIVKSPRAVPPSPSSDPEYVPAHVRREVWRRDGGKCQFPMPDGGICGSTFQLEIDHVVPRAAGGPSTADNCRLACRPHNQLAARRFFGGDWMDRYRRSPRDVCPSEAAQGNG